MPGATVAGVERRFSRPSWLIGHLVVLILLLTCLRLGWWQWERTRDADGTMQNLAYAILWPAFGFGFVYMWVRFLSLEKRRDLDDDHAMDAGLRTLLAQDAAPGHHTSLLAGDNAAATTAATAAASPADGSAAAETAETARSDAHKPDVPGEAAREPGAAPAPATAPAAEQAKPATAPPDDSAVAATPPRSGSAIPTAAPADVSGVPATPQGTEVFIGYVDDSDDPELAAYNRALAALAEEDNRGRA